MHNIITRHAIELQENSSTRSRLHDVRNNVRHLIRVSCCVSLKMKINNSYAPHTDFKINFVLQIGASKFDSGVSTSGAQKWKQ